MFDFTFVKKIFTAIKNAYTPEDNEDNGAEERDLNDPKYEAE